MGNHGARGSGTGAQIDRRPVATDDLGVEPSCMVHAQRSLVLLLVAVGTVLGLAMPVRAFTYAVQVRWVPSTDPSVVSYQVFERSGGSTVGVSQPGTPSVAADGTLSLVVTGLDVRTDYAFAVKAYRADGTESEFSNEVGIGYLRVAPFVDSDGDGLTDAQEDGNLNRIVDPGETDPQNPDTDGDGVGDLADVCQDTPHTEAVDAFGCSCSQISCDDGNGCTTDACLAGMGCSHVPIPGCIACSTAVQCDDANRCTTDLCTGGRCDHRPTEDGSACAGDFCGGIATCHAGACLAGSPAACDDGNRCTTDRCDASQALGRCIHTSTPNCCMSDADCPDSDVCTINERCQAGSCVSDPLACPDPGPCAMGSCDPRARCVTIPLPDGSPCSDGDPCSEKATCAGGACRPVEDVGPRRDLAVAGLAVRATAGGAQSLIGRAAFARPADLDPTRTGVDIELQDDRGTTLYSATLPGTVFRKGSHSTYRLAPWPNRVASGSVRKLVFRLRRDRIDVLMKVLAPGVLTAGTHRVIWMLRLGDECVRDVGLVCAPTGAGAAICR